MVLPPFVTVAPKRILGIREEMTPLRLQQVDDVQVFALRLRSAVRAEEMYMRVATEPALRIHVRPALEPQRQLALPGSTHARP